MNLSKTKRLLLGLIIIFISGCEGDQGPAGATGSNGLNGIDGNNSLVNITNIRASDDCENGGIKVDVGIDNDSNGTLESNEILSTSYVCNGVDGNTSLTTVTTEPAGDNCENGGVKINSGVDTNGDGILDTNEITTTAYVCNGIDGNNSLIKTTSEAAGMNCDNGGVKIDSGVDINGDGTLDDTEVTATTYVCNGIDGNDSLTKITNEPAGTNCENGGIKIDSGVDANGNGTLDDAEINATAYACNGVDGNISLVNVTDEVAGDNCENGGVKIESGVDDNGNGTLDEEEISVTRFICNGIDGGFDEQIRLVIYSSKVAACTCGANRFEGDLIDFDKRNWVGVDSIIFIPSMYADLTGFPAFAELYDQTNSQVIANSTVSTSNTTATHVKSINIYDDLPEEEVDLSIQIRTENPNINATGTVLTGKSYLMLYRSN